MKKNHTSTTAEGLALMRAIETSRPAGQRILEDPLARSFVNPISFVLSKWFIDAGLYARLSPGAREFIASRDRFIDDFLKDSLADGLDQVVILGAGYDTRAYRIPGVEKVRVFEVDHPATQAEKVRHIRKAVDPLPANVTFVPLDLNTRTLADALHETGYNPRGKSLFIAQGLTPYITAEAVDDLFFFIAKNSAAGSPVVFDYFYAAALRTMKTEKRITRSVGEAMIFGIEEGKVEEFLTQRGFCEVGNYTTEDIICKYFPNLTAERGSFRRGVCIATAKVCSNFGDTAP